MFIAIIIITFPFLVLLWDNFGGLETNVNIPLVLNLTDRDKIDVRVLATQSCSGLDFSVGPVCERSHENLRITHF